MLRYQQMTMMCGKLTPTCWKWEIKSHQALMEICKLLVVLCVCVLASANVSTLFWYMFLFQLLFFFWARYRGTYCSQDVAIKVLKPERVNTDMQREFAQEVYIMRFLFSFACLFMWSLTEKSNSTFLFFLLKYIYLYRKVRHKNVVQFIGACTKPPSLCIVTGRIS